MSKKKKKISRIYIKTEMYYNNLILLNLFLTEHGKILPRRVTGLTLQQQKKLAKSIKQARILGLIAFVR